MNNNLFKKLSKSQLQLIAAAAMLIDHTAYFVGFVFPSLYYLMKLIGRATIIIMCFFIVEGFHKTHNLNRYLIRMAIFAAVSQIPFFLCSRGALPTGIRDFILGNFHHRNVIFTLFIGLSLITILRSRYSVLLKLAALAAAFRLVQSSDWRMYALLWILAFEVFYGCKRKQLAAASLVLILRFVFITKSIISDCVIAGYITVDNLAQIMITLGGFIAIGLLAFYNGEKGRLQRLNLYVFYPAHLLVLAVIKIIFFQ